MNKVAFGVETQPLQKGSSDRSTAYGSSEASKAGEMPLAEQAAKAIDIMLSEVEERNLGFSECSRKRAML